MRQALREVAEEGAALGIDLLGVEADVVGQGDQLVHELGRLLDSPLPRQRLGQPKRAGHEGAVFAGQAVLAHIAADDRAVGELAPHGVDCGAKTGRLGVVVPGQHGQ